MTSVSYAALGAIAKLGEGRKTGRETQDDGPRQSALGDLAEAGRDLRQGSIGARDLPPRDGLDGLAEQSHQHPDLVPPVRPRAAGRDGLVAKNLQVERLGLD